MNDEYDALVGILKNVGMLLGVHVRHDDVATLDVPHALLPTRSADLVVHALDPRSGGIDQRPRAELGLLASRILRRDTPKAIVSARRDERRARADVGAAFARADCIDHDQPRVVDARVRVDESLAEAVLEARTPPARRQVDSE